MKKRLVASLALVGAFLAIARLTAAPHGGGRGGGGMRSSSGGFHGRSVSTGSHVYAGGGARGGMAGGTRVGTADRTRMATDRVRSGDRVRTSATGTRVRGTDHVRTAGVTTGVRRGDHVHIAGRTWHGNRYAGRWGNNWRGYGRHGRFYPWFYTSFGGWYGDPCWNTGLFGGRRYRYYCYYDSYPWLIDLMAAGDIAQARQRLEEERRDIEDLRDRDEREAKLRELDYLEGGLEKGSYE